MFALWKMSVTIKRTWLAIEQEKEDGISPEVSEIISEFGEIIKNGNYKNWKSAGILNEETYDNEMYSGCDHIRITKGTERLIYFTVKEETVWIFSVAGHPPKNLETHSKQNASFMKTSKWWIDEKYKIQIEHDRALLESLKQGKELSEEQTEKFNDKIAFSHLPKKVSEQLLKLREEERQDERKKQELKNSKKFEQTI
jgi:hypothetical protein